MSAYIPLWDRPGTAQPLTGTLLHGVRLDILSGCVFSQEVRLLLRLVGGWGAELQGCTGRGYSQSQPCWVLGVFSKIWGDDGVIRDLRNHQFCTDL